MLVKIWVSYSKESEIHFRAFSVQYVCSLRLCDKLKETNGNSQKPMLSVPVIIRPVISNYNLKIFLCDANAPFLPFLNTPVAHYKIVFVTYHIVRNHCST